MSNTNIEQMKKIIEDKKKKSSQQSGARSETTKLGPSSSKGFKNTKRSGSLNK